jgi:hypothetical protein
LITVEDRGSRVETDYPVVIAVPAGISTDYWGEMFIRDTDAPQYDDRHARSFGPGVRRVRDDRAGRPKMTGPVEAGEMEFHDGVWLSTRTPRSAPEGFGDECPICGDPFDVGASGCLFPDVWDSTDVRSWVRCCTGGLPEHLRETVDAVHEPGWETVPFGYVHKDAHVDAE